MNFSDAFRVYSTAIVAKYDRSVNDEIMSLGIIKQYSGGFLE
jgi:hypothetical protein